MRRNPIIAMTALGFCFWLSGNVLAGGRKFAPGAGRVGGGFVGAAPRGQIQRFWEPPILVLPNQPFHSRGFFYPYSYYSRDPRSVIIITPSPYYPFMAPGGRAVTSEPFYCHVHHQGFVSRAGFLDHISGTHKIPLATADSICSDTEASCVIEGY